MSGKIMNFSKEQLNTFYKNCKDQCIRAEETKSFYDYSPDSFERKKYWLVFKEVLKLCKDMNLYSIRSLNGETLTYCGCWVRDTFVKRWIEIIDYLIVNIPGFPVLKEYEDTYYGLIHYKDKAITDLDELMEDIGIIEEFFTVRENTKSWQ